MQASLATLGKLERCRSALENIPPAVPAACPLFACAPVPTTGYLETLPLLVSFPMLALTQLSDYLTLKGSFSAVSKPNFASKYALE